MDNVYLLKFGGNAIGGREDLDRLSKEIAGLIKDGICYGAMLYNEATRAIEAVTADALVIATGGQNAIFGKTT